MPKISPFLWFDNQAEEAMNFYVSIFKNAKVGNVSRYPEGSPFMPGAVMSATFELEGQYFMTLNAGPMYTFNQAISFFVDCEDQAEVDFYWERLLEGGEEGNCGWIKDKFGLWWQIVPKALGEYLGGEDREGAGRAMQAMMQMHKIETDKLKEAYEG